MMWEKGLLVMQKEQRTRGGVQGGGRRVLGAICVIKATFVLGAICMHRVVRPPFARFHGARVDGEVDFERRSALRPVFVRRGSYP